MRRTMIAVVAALLPLVALPSVAQAATAPVVNWAGSKDGDLGTLRISASAEAGVTGLTADLHLADGETTATVSEFQLVEGTVQDGVWETPAPVQLTELDVYQVDVVATDADGQQTSRENAGALAYLVTSFFELTTDRPTIDYFDRSVTVHGTLSGRWPADRSVHPLAGRPVTVDAFPSPSVDAVTGADGTFTATVELEGETRLTASFWSDEPGILNGTSDAVLIGITPTPTELTMTVDRKKVNAGEPITITGRVTWQTPDGWLPVAGKSVGILFCRAVQPDICDLMDESPTTDADGNFQVVVTPHETGLLKVFYQAHDQWGSADPFIERAEQAVDVVVVQRVSFQDFYGRRDESGNVTVQGRIEFEVFSPTSAPVDLQFRPTTGSGEWTTVRTVDADFSFEEVFEAPPSGEWRAYYAGEPDLYQPATSEVSYVE